MALIDAISRNGLIEGISDSARGLWDRVTSTAPSTLVQNAVKPVQGEVLKSDHLRYVTEHALNKDTLNRRIDQIGAKLSHANNGGLSITGTQDQINAARAALHEHGLNKKAINTRFSHVEDELLKDGNEAKLEHITQLQNAAETSVGKMSWAERVGRKGLSFASRNSGTIGKGLLIAAATTAGLELAGSVLGHQQRQPNEPRPKHHIGLIVGSAVIGATFLGAKGLKLDGVLSPTGFVAKLEKEAANVTENVR